MKPEFKFEDLEGFEAQGLTNVQRVTMTDHTPMGMFQQVSITVNGALHSINDEPAQVNTYNGVVIKKTWCKHGKIHRLVGQTPNPWDDKPAIMIFSDTGQLLERQYWLHSKLLLKKKVSKMEKLKQIWADMKAKARQKKELNFFFGSASIQGEERTVEELDAEAGNLQKITGSPLIVVCLMFNAVMMTGLTLLEFLTGFTVVPIILTAIAILYIVSTYNFYAEEKDTGGFRFIVKRK